LNLYSFGLEILVDMGVKDIVSENSLVVVQQIKGEFQCFDELLSRYLDRCLVIVKSLDTFTMKHISREENPRANFFSMASFRLSYWHRKKFHTRETYASRCW
jgi:hypothetical protein